MEKQQVALASEAFDSRYTHYRKISDDIRQEFANQSRAPASTQKAIVEKYQREDSKLQGLFLWTPNGNFFLWGDDKIAELPSALNDAQEILAPGELNLIRLKGDDSHLWISTHFDSSWMLIGFDEEKFLQWTSSLDHFEFQPEAGLSIEGNWFGNKEPLGEFPFNEVLWSLLYSALFSIIATTLAGWNPIYRKLNEGSPKTKKEQQAA